MRRSIVLSFLSVLLLATAPARSIAQQANDHICFPEAALRSKTASTDASPNSGVRTAAWLSLAIQSQQPSPKSTRIPRKPI
jgi:hypothetical protein